MNRNESDICIINGDRRYELHKTILKEIPYFKTILESDFIESNQRDIESNQREIGVEFDHFSWEKIKKYIYDCYEDKQLGNNNCEEKIFSKIGIWNIKDSELADRLGLVWLSERINKNVMKFLSERSPEFYLKGFYDKGGLDFIKDRLNQCEFLAKNNFYSRKILIESDSFNRFVFFLKPFILEFFFCMYSVDKYIYTLCCLSTIDRNFLPFFQNINHQDFTDSELSNLAFLPTSPLSEYLSELLTLEYNNRDKLDNSEIEKCILDKTLPFVYDNFLYYLVVKYYRSYNKPIVPILCLAIDQSNILLIYFLSYRLSSNSPIFYDSLIQKLTTYNSLYLHPLLSLNIINDLILFVNSINPHSLQLLSLANKYNLRFE